MLAFSLMRFPRRRIERGSILWRADPRDVERADSARRGKQIALIFQESGAASIRRTIELGSPSR
jgi:hypothetical protein